MLLQPVEIAIPGVRFNLPEQFDNVGLEAWLTRIGIRYHRFDLNRDYEPIRSNQPRPSDSFAG
jgi:hypothetical protein